MYSNNVSLLIPICAVRLAKRIFIALIICVICTLCAVSGEITDLQNLTQKISERNSEIASTPNERHNGSGHLNAIGCIAIGCLFVFLFDREKKKPEYRALVQASTVKYSLNLVPLLRGFKRGKEDPLRPAHVKLAKVGLRYTFFMIGGMVIWIFAVAIIRTL